MVPRCLQYLRVATLIGCSWAALCVQAQIAVPATKADPLDPKAPVPAVRYESPFKSVKPRGDDKPVSWREANDTVTRIGGWRVYARQAQQADAAAASAPRRTAP